MQAKKKSQEPQELPDKILNKKRAPMKKSHSFHYVPKKKKHDEEERSFASKLSMFKSIDSQSPKLPRNIISPIQNKNQVTSPKQDTTKQKFESPKQMHKFGKDKVDSTKSPNSLPKQSRIIDTSPMKKATHRVYVRSKTEEIVVHKSSADKDTQKTKLKTKQSELYDYEKKTYQVHLNNPESIIPTSDIQTDEVKYEYKNYLDGGEDFIDSYLKNAEKEVKNIPTEEVISSENIQQQHSAMDPVFLDKKPNQLKRQNHVKSSSSSVAKSFESDDYISEEDGNNCNLKRNRSFRRSIVIEDEVGLKRRKSTGGACVSVFFTPISPKQQADDKASKQTICQQFKEVLTQLDNMVVSEVNFGKDFEAVKKLHSLFWEVKDAEKKQESKEKNPESLSSVLNY